ncbi:MAG: hypothetical protein S4CHLAM45_08230 [Chlamydiales bacterium]|nr:hypothetical protein [Chlamydiales bacterium]MCH9620425.1 hypothetical protein [Chlamydiales bacterium]MCH9622929.1 hypothetical protein [Chlamydiales bacterium]
MEKFDTYSLWKSHLKPGDLIIDATIGNGHDTLLLAKILAGDGTLIGYDIQKKAIESTEKKLLTLFPHERKIISLKQKSHANFDEQGAALIVYNLGYLPTGDKKITTLTETTLQSLESAFSILDKNGMLSIMCYPGHGEGEKEERAILKFLSQVDKRWVVRHTKLVNRHKAPSWIVVIPS